jgi:hypothetical protein
LETNPDDFPRPGAFASKSHRRRTRVKATRMKADAVPAAPPRCGKCSHKVSNHWPISPGKLAKGKDAEFHCTLPLSVLGRECGCALTADEVKNLSR